MLTPRAPNLPVPTTATDSNESLPDAYARIRLSYEMAVAGRACWAATAQKMDLPMEQRFTAQKLYKQSDATVHYYSSLLYQLEILNSMQQPLP